MNGPRHLAAVILSVIGIAACAPAVDPDLASSAGVNGPWRHWEPQAVAETAIPSAKGASPSDPDAVILALHGFNDYSNAFQDFAAYSETRNVAVHAYDQRGFGANPDRGLWPGMDRLAADLETAVGRLRERYDGVPLYLLGESMGGAVAIVGATGEPALDVDGLILSAPAVWGGPHMNLFYRFTLSLASTLAPGWTLTGGGLGIRPSDNIDMLRAFSADPLVIKGTRTDAIAGLVALMDRALALAPDLDGELLLLIGEKDEIIPSGALDDFQGRLRNDDITAIRYPNGYHMLLRDLQREKVFADIHAWIDRRTRAASAGPGRALAGTIPPFQTKVLKNNP